MKTRPGALLLLVGVAAIALSNRCNGANEISGPADPRQGQPTPPPQVVTPHGQVTPNPCRQNPADCD